MPPSLSFNIQSLIIIIFVCYNKSSQKCAINLMSRRNIVSKVTDMKCFSSSSDRSLSIDFKSLIILLLPLSIPFTTSLMISIPLLFDTSLLLSSSELVVKRTDNTVFSFCRFTLPDTSTLSFVTLLGFSELLVINVDGSVLEFLPSKLKMSI